MSKENISSSYVEIANRFAANVGERDDSIRIVYSIMENFVDRAFGVDAVQQVASESAQPSVAISKAFRPRAHQRRNRNDRRRARIGGRRTSHRHTIKGGETKCRKRA